MKLLDIDSNGDVVLKDGSGNSIKLTNNGSIDASSPLLELEAYTRDELTLDFTPPTSSGVYTGSGLSVTIDVKFGQIIELESNGIVKHTGTIDGHAFLMRFELSDGTMVSKRTYYHKDGENVASVVPYHFQETLIGGKDIPTGSQTIELTCRNLTPVTERWEGAINSRVCYIAAKQFIVKEPNLPNGIQFHQDELASNYSLVNTSTTFTDIGLSVDITALTDQWIEVFFQGQIATGTPDNFDIEVALVVDGTIERVWQSIDNNIATQRKPVDIYHAMQLTSGVKTIKIQAKNNQGTTVNFQGGTAQTCTLDVTQHGVD